MNIKTRKLGRNKWEMRLIEPDGTYVDVTGDLARALDYARTLGGHDSLVKLINEELVASEYTMYSRQAYDRWHWYDETEMNSFITHFLLKNS